MAAEAVSGNHHPANISTLLTGRDEVEIFDRIAEIYCGRELLVIYCFDSGDTIQCG
jgi:hypothetical protein